jgi:moderate conductance mechanosensitive channel
MITLLFADQINTTVQQSSSALKEISDTIFNAHSLLSLAISLFIAFLVGRLLAAMMRKLTHAISRQADKTENLATVNRLRRTETLIVLSIALVRALLVIFALYFWWVYTHPHEQPTAIIGASALFALVLGGVLSPVLRDVAAGSVMMAEHWFGVGDHITIEPFTLQGIVERITLRSTKVRSLSGEVIWVNNQAISAVQVTPKGIRTIAFELFVTNPHRGITLLEEANRHLPTGPLMVATPLTVMTQENVGENLWHLTAIGEVAPGREWLLDKFAIQVIQELDGENKTHILATEPITRYTDSEAEKRFARTIKNARKHKTKRTLPTRKRQSKIQ